MLDSKGSVGGLFACVFVGRLSLQIITYILMFFKEAELIEVSESLSGEEVVSHMTTTVWLLILSLKLAPSQTSLIVSARIISGENTQLGYFSKCLDPPLRKRDSSCSKG